MDQSSKFRITWQDLCERSLETDPENGVYTDSFGTLRALLNDSSVNGRFESHIVRPGVKVIMINIIGVRHGQIS
jgi:hypothetical protein